MFLFLKAVCTCCFPLEHSIVISVMFGVKLRARVPFLQMHVVLCLYVLVPDSCVLRFAITFKKIQEISTANTFHGSL